ncbi:hypothetical protein I4I84_04740 [Pseudonocardia sp. KRD-182]|uniref:hypothetical protein n=1 Tax=Pseudonocardia oceani TaxID=2792013 RepID=UPI001C4A13A2|nr:hypothetical protein [Pseudonocardia oceani]MBW0108045.1 hypothetical protein [Pseudonocardia oceani]
MTITSKAAMAITGAVLVTVLGAAGAGVAFATPSAAAPSGAVTQATPDDAADPANIDAAGMDEMMRQMVKDLPAEQRDAATRMHEEMRPAMESMMSGEMAGMDQMGETGEHHDEMPTG